MTRMLFHACIWIVCTAMTFIGSSVLILFALMMSPVAAAYIAGCLGAAAIAAWKASRSWKL